MRFIFLPILLLLSLTTFAQRPDECYDDSDTLLIVGGSLINSSNFLFDRAKLLANDTVFVSTQTGTVYGIATAGNINISGSRATADLILHEPVYTEDGDLYPGIVRSNQAIIPSLQPNEPQYVSVIVYLNGNTTMSSMLASGSAVSLDGVINLQFSNGTEALVSWKYD